MNTPSRRLARTTSPSLWCTTTSGGLLSDQRANASDYMGAPGTNTCASSTRMMPAAHARCGTRQEGQEGGGVHMNETRQGERGAGVASDALGLRDFAPADATRMRLRARTQRKREARGVQAEGLTGPSTELPERFRPSHRARVPLARLAVPGVGGVLHSRVPAGHLLARRHGLLQGAALGVDEQLPASSAMPPHGAVRAAVLSVGSAFA